MLYRVYFLMLLQMCLLVSSTFAAGITIVMTPEVSIDGAFMTLGQLADISGDDDIVIKKMQQFQVGNAPLPGKSVVLTKELLIMRLGNIGANLNDIVWQMPETVTVTTRSQSIRGQILLDKAITAIEERAGRSVSSGELSIAPIGSVQDAIIPTGDIVLTSDFPYGIRYNSPTAITIAVHVNGQIVSKINLRFEVKLYQQVVVTMSQISPGELFTTDNLRYMRMDIGRLGLGFFTDKSKLQELIARRLLAPGIVVTEAMVKKPVLIHRGSMVTILARIGSMEVIATGQAMQDGSEGQLIRVQNINSNKIILGKVVDGSTVQVLSYKSKV